MQASDNKSWYREPWPWILISLPLTAVIASLISAWLAVISDDGLVADDYYKQGMAINQVLHRDAAAVAMNLGATLHTSADGHTVQVALSGNLSPFPDRLRLSILHPTQAGHDHVITLHAASGDIYRGTFPGLGKARWRVLLESPQGNWRLTGIWRQPGTGTLILGHNNQVK
ncbi:MAG: FixH family protein [Sulfuriferula sp.]